MPNPRSASVVLYHGGDIERIAELHRAVERAERVAEAEADVARAGDDSPAAEAKEAYAAFVAEAAERAEVWTLEAIGHEEFRQLLTDHPPRREGDEVNAGDAMFGVNTQTFPKALLLFVDPEDDEIRTVTDPADDLAKRLKRLSAGEFDTLWVRAFMLNTAGVADPKASLS